MSTTQIPDIDALKTRLKNVWMAGDFGVIARVAAEASHQIIGRLDITPGMKILDVACGTGNSAIPAAQRGAEVIGIDIAPNLLEQARARAKEAGVSARFEEGDAEKIAYPDASFDAVVTVFGAMFAPRPDLVASELKRVVRKGGKIVMGNWTPRSHPGEMFKLNGKYMAPPAGMTPPVLWGDEETVQERFREGISDLKMTPRITPFPFDGDVAGIVQLFIEYFGPTKKTYESLDASGQEAFRKDLEALWAKNNRATDGTVRTDNEFLEVIATRA
ncbi:MAG: class I SAM-dependent methyltransferase [Candidatus Eiseniibacteriota bacterium]